MKSTFVKIEGQTNWFLLVSPNGQFNETLRPNMKMTACRNEVIVGLGYPFRSCYETQLRTRTILELNIDYVKQATLCKFDLLVRANGSYMTLLEVSDITETKEAHTFPL